MFSGVQTMASRSLASISRSASRLLQSNVQKCALPAASSEFLNKLYKFFTKLLQSASAQTMLSPRREFTPVLPPSKLPLPPRFVFFLVR